MNRVRTVLAAARAVRPRHYLEIGVLRGECILRVPAERKTGVDPAGIVWGSPLRRAWMTALRPANRCVRWHRATSDEYFAGPAPADLASFPPDLVFIDGLHTAAQAYRDILNCLRWLAPGGVVLLHDCNPTTPAMAFPAGSYEAAAAARPEGWDGQWCGNVWQALVRVRRDHPELSACVLDVPGGMGVIVRAADAWWRPLPFPAGTPAETYEDLSRARRALLDLRPADAGAFRGCRRTPC